MSTSLSRYITSLILEQAGQHSRVSLSDYLSLRFKGANISNLSIPRDLSPRQRWLLDQLIAIVDELRDNDIDSQEYLNSDNLGIKKDGSLGLFDMGFGDYFSAGSPGDETISLEGGEGTLLGQILERLGIERAVLLGSGMFGHAYDIGGGKVLKITRDKTEAANSNRVKGKKNRHLANIFDVKQLRMGDKPMKYIIILERLELGSAIEGDIIGLSEEFDNHRNNHLDKRVIERVRDKFVRDFLRDRIEIGYEGAWDKWGDKIREIDSDVDFNDVSEIADWVKDSASNFNDIEDAPPQHVLNLVQRLMK